MVVNFRARGINRGVHKLARTFMLIIKKKTLKNNLMCIVHQGTRLN